MFMRDWTTTRFIKAIKITQEHSNYVNKTRGKKSKAGRLEEIIKTFIQQQSMPVPDNNVNKVFDEFYKWNPAINYGNITWRKATEWLIDRHGVERVIKVIEFIGTIRAMPYAPRISNPYQLKEKWADLETFALTEKNKQQSKEDKKGLKIGSIT